MIFKIVGFITMEIGFLADICLSMILREDPAHQLTKNKSVSITILIYSAFVGIWIEMFLRRWGWFGQMACGVLAAYLLVASIQDHQSYEVYDFLHILVVPVGLLFVLAEPSGEKVLSLLIYSALQLGLFVKMYGFGDGLVFMVCAVFESRFGAGLHTYLLHMAAVFLALAMVQGCKRNINRKGNLKKPVPLVPYIAATVWFFL